MSETGAIICVVRLDGGVFSMLMSSYVSSELVSTSLITFHRPMRRKENIEKAKKKAEAAKKAEVHEV